MKIMEIMEIIMTDNEDNDDNEDYLQVTPPLVSLCHGRKECRVT